MVIDGVLHRENVPDASRWCIVVPCELSSDLLKEAHACLLLIHFSELSQIILLVRHKVCCLEGSSVEVALHVRDQEVVFDLHFS